MKIVLRTVGSVPFPEIVVVEVDEATGIGEEVAWFFKLKKANEYLHLRHKENPNIKIEIAP